MSKKLTFGAVLAFAFLTFAGLYYAGWVADSGNNPQNQVLANAATFASVGTAALAILVSAFAIYLEKKRADERDETAAPAWTSLTQLAHAIYALDVTLIDIGGLDGDSTRDQIQQYADALNDLEAALSKAVETTSARALGIVWTNSLDFDGGVATNALVARLRTRIATLNRQGEADLPETEALIGLNAIYRAITALRWKDFRSMWESGYLAADYSMNEPPNLMIDWGEDLFALSAYIVDDFAHGGKHSVKSMRITAPARPSLSARFRAARAAGYLRSFRIWLPAGRNVRQLKCRQDSLPEYYKRGVFWDAETSPADLRLAQWFVADWEDEAPIIEGDLYWMGILGGTMLGDVMRVEGSIFQRPRSAKHDGFRQRQ